MHCVCYKNKRVWNSPCQNTPYPVAFATVKRFDHYFHCILIGTFTGSDSHTNEYCSGETFRPRCAGGSSDVIVMLTAQFGRMRFGRCLVEEPGFAPMANNPRFVGCFDDVKQVLDQRCSGLSECDVRITDQTFEGTQPCYAGLKMHLEASFMCIKGSAVITFTTVNLISLFYSLLIIADVVSFGLCFDSL